MTTPHLLLALAIVSEVIATTALKASDGFTRPGASLLVVAGYGLAFFLLSLTLRSLSLGFTYAVWSGLGIVLVALTGAFFYGERIDAAGLAGIALIVSGVLVLNLLSNASGA
jgi:small multidrug resistance pump